MKKTLEECSKSSLNIIEPQVSLPKQVEGQRSEDAVPLQGSVRPVCVTGQTSASRGTNTCLMAKKDKKKRTKGGKIEKNEASSSLAKELDALKSENVSLVCKYDSLSRQYDKVVKSFAHVAAVDQENEVLEEKLGKLTSEHMALQAIYK
jgi:predicted RNase H-like nuclease (RuvC/YqgF family)